MAAEDKTHWEINDNSGKNLPKKVGTDMGPGKSNVLTAPLARSHDAEDKTHWVSNDKGNYVDGAKNPPKKFGTDFGPGTSNVLTAPPDRSHDAHRKLAAPTDRSGNSDRVVDPRL